MIGPFTQLTKPPRPCGRVSRRAIYILPNALVSAYSGVFSAFGSAIFAGPPFADNIPIRNQRYIYEANETNETAAAKPPRAAESGRRPWNRAGAINFRRPASFRASFFRAFASSISGPRPAPFPARGDFGKWQAQRRAKNARKRGHHVWLKFISSVCFFGLPAASAATWSRRVRWFPKCIIPWASGILAVEMEEFRKQKTHNRENTRKAETRWRGKIYSAFLLPMASASCRGRLAAGVALIS